MCAFVFHVVPCADVCCETNEGVPVATDDRQGQPREPYERGVDGHQAHQAVRVGEGLPRPHPRPAEQGAEGAHVVHGGRRRDMCIFPPT